MNNNSFTFSINHESDIIKYQQLINSINNAITENLLEKGDLLPSVNNICKDFGFEYKIITNPKEFDIEKNKAYIGVSDRMLGVFLEQCREKDLESGVDVGFLSYNETPMKKFIYKGISVVTTDFKELGTKGAEFITKDGPMQCYVPTKLVIRESL